MRKIAIVFILLLTVFFLTWGIKVKTPVNRPENVEDAEELPWYESDYTSPVADEEWYLDPTIPDEYVPVPGEDDLFMVVDNDGTITGYRRRTLQDDGTWTWENVNPDIPDNYELVAGTDNLYKVTDADGKVSYFLYIRNEDNSFCFVACDEAGVPYYNGEDAEVIASNYIHEDGNVYSVYNVNGVKEGYAERVKTESGSYIWISSEAPLSKTPSGSDDEENEAEPPVTENADTQQNIPVSGTYIVTNKSTNTVTENGYNVTYETIIYNTYDSNGTLLFTRKEGPYEISRVKADAAEKPNQDMIQDTLDGEYQRVSAQVTYDTEKAQNVLTKLNAERANQGLPGLTMSTDTEAYKLACIRVADMAIYHYSASESPLYGTLDDMITRWHCQTAGASENIWKAGNKTADEIHTRLQAYDGSRNVRMSESYTEVGIAIVEKDGEVYIAEVYLR